MQPTLKNASISTRIIGAVIDQLIILLLIAAELYIYFSWIESLLPSHSVLQYIVLYLPILLIPFAYRISLEYFFNKTVGKIICRTKVVDEEGNKPSLAAICRRTLWRISIGGPITSIYLISYFDEKGNFTRMNHDVHSRTLVIQE